MRASAAFGGTGRATGVSARIPARLRRAPSTARAVAWGLAGLAVVVLLGTLALPEIGLTNGRLHVGASLGADRLDFEGDSALGARFSGVDKHGRPFSVAADRTDVERATGMMKLERPTAKLTMADGRAVQLSADRGVYRQAASLLDLDGRVLMLAEPGYRAETEHAVIDLRAATVLGAQPVDGRATFGSVQGKGFEVSGPRDSIVVKGPATLNLNSVNPNLQ